MRRIQVPADCPIHGHPQHVTPRNHALLELYRIVQGVNGLNETVLYFFCKDEELEFLRIYSHLAQIDTLMRTAKTVETTENGG